MSPQAEGDVTVSGFHDLRIFTQPRGRLVPLAGWAVCHSNTHAQVAGLDTVTLLFKIFCAVHKAGRIQTLKPPQSVPGES